MGNGTERSGIAHEGGDRKHKKHSSRKHADDSMRDSSSLSCVEQPEELIELRDGRAQQKRASRTTTKSRKSGVVDRARVLDSPVIDDFHQRSVIRFVKGRDQPIDVLEKELLTEQEKWNLSSVNYLLQETYGKGDSLHGFLSPELWTPPASPDSKRSLELYCTTPGQSTLPC
jgi:hypothetical protein